MAKLAKNLDSMRTQHILAFDFGLHADGLDWRRHTVRVNSPRVGLFHPPRPPSKWKFVRDVFRRRSAVVVPI